MINKQIRAYFVDKENAACPLTNALIEGGYKQKSGGYIKYAKECGMENPSQYWHLIESWSARRDENAPFNKRIQCGELLFWMAEVSHAMPEEKLNRLLMDVLKKPSDRRNGNKMIKEACFDRIKDEVEKSF